MQRVKSIQRPIQKPIQSCIKSRIQNWCHPLLQATARAVSACVLMMLPLLHVSAATAFAQAQSPAPASSASRKAPVAAATPAKPTHAARLKHARHPRVRPPHAAPKNLAAAPPAVPPPPPPPDWPALKAATPAQVHWDGRQLSVTADNSSLLQVIAAISAQTHVPVTGLQNDQRLFGAYGPGTPQQVLAELLEGSGYDLLILDGKVPGIPQRVELSRRGNDSTPSDRPAYNPPQPGAQPANPALAQQQLNPPAPPPSIAQPGMTPQQFIQQRMQAMQQQRQPSPPPQ